MKGSGTIVASILAASTVAWTSSSSDSSSSFSNGDRSLSLSSSSSSNQPKTTSENDKFAPKFDGLRFIETLVTAHR